MFKSDKYRSASLKVLVIASLSLTSVLAEAHGKDGGVVLGGWEIIFPGSVSDNPEPKKAR